MAVSYVDILWSRYVRLQAEPILLMVAIGITINDYVIDEGLYYL